MAEARRGPAWVPHAFTAARVALGVAVFAGPGSLSTSALFWLAAAAAVTDGLDGVLARRWGAATRGGAAFDLAADGVFFLACFVAFWRLGLWPGWLVVTILLAAVPAAAAQALLLMRLRRPGSPRRVWNRVLGGYSYLCVLAVFGGLAPLVWGLGQALLAWVANVADLVWAVGATDAGRPASRLDLD